ncbi:MAG: class I SAM-dependent methyltransferase [Lachnospiraceae bacterium]|nr:class I SAM-dependent methyltransferase [Lachnospiraceae bacterium]
MTRVEEAVQRLRSELEQKEILEAACGCAEFSIHAAKYAKTVQSIDLDSRRLSPKVKGCQNLTFCEMDVTAMSYKDDSFDTVVLYNAIGHLWDVLGKAVEECLRVLRVGGNLHIISSVKMDKHVISHDLIPMVQQKKHSFLVTDEGMFTDVQIKK